MKKIKGPNKETVASKNYIYLDLPTSMDDCFYDLKLKTVKLTENEDKYVAVFEVLDTDTKVRKGAEISHMMDPYQKFAETYFWRDIFTLYCVTRGKEASEENIKPLVDKSDKILEKVTSEDFKGVGGACTCRITSYTNKEDQRKTRREWSPLDAE